MEAARFDAGTGAGEGGGENNGVSEGQSISGVRLGGIDVDPFMAGERDGVEPCAVGEQGVAA